MSDYTSSLVGIIEAIEQPTDNLLLTKNETIELIKALQHQVDTCQHCEDSL